MSQSDLSSTIDACLLVRDGFGQYRPASPKEVLSAARSVMRSRVRRGAAMTSPEVVKDHLKLHLGLLEHEVFAVLFLDSQHRLIAYREMFRGTLTQTSVYPREVVKEALTLNTAAVILAHNHPSGSAEPSWADEFLTQQLKSALALVDVRVIDHMVVTGDAVTSFAERGLL